MNKASLFEHWRTSKRPEQSWGLAWFLASEFCTRYYASHGLVPWVIDHEGLGYYGITINRFPCMVNGQSTEALGRFTMSGDVENWRTGDSGDHGCELIEMCANGVSTEQLIHMAISHLDIPPVPSKSHLSCRHKRWGSSFELSFEIATMVALQYEPEEIQIWNHPAHTNHAVKTRDPHFRMKEHPGAFLFISAFDEKNVCIAGDGRLLDGSDRNLWHEYMSGRTPKELSDMIIGDLLSGEKKHKVKQSRAPKLLGDFGEGLVTYALIRKGYEVACVDHVGADLIAEKNGSRFAVSVKTRLFKKSSKESLSFVVERLHFEKLEHFAKQFGMTPMFALVICIADENSIHLMMSRAENIRNQLPEVKHGYAFRFAKSTRKILIENPFIDYSCWAQESIGSLDFD